MLLCPHFPRPPLDRYVELIWVVRGSSPGNRERVLPNGAVELIFNLGAAHTVLDPEGNAVLGRYRTNWVAGLQERPLVIEAEDDTTLIGVRFRPGGAFPFLRLPLSELTNAVVECELFLGAFARELHERLFEASDDRQRIEALEAALTSRLRLDTESRGRWLPIALARLAAGEAVGDVADAVGVSVRQFARRVRSRVGTSPKLLARILRLQQVINHLAAQPRPVDWVQSALAAGYFDQAHLVRDFRLLAGVSPTEYLRRRDVNPNHVRESH